MEYVYAGMLLHKAGKEVNEENVKKVLEAAGIEVNDAKLKALVASLDGVDIEAAIKEAVVAPVAAAESSEAGGEEKKEEAKEEKKTEEKGTEGQSKIEHTRLGDYLSQIEVPQFPNNTASCEVLEFSVNNQADGELPIVSWKTDCNGDVSVQVKTTISSIVPNECDVNDGLWDGNKSYRSGKRCSSETEGFQRLLPGSGIRRSTWVLMVIRMRRP